MTTNVPPLAFTPQGPVVPSEAVILAGVQADINAAFGGDVNPGLNTPQGQLASSTAAIIGDSNDEFLQYIAGVDPAFSSGRMQDGIARIYFLTRNPAVPTIVEGTCTGLPGTVIPAGSLVSDTSGNVYECLTGGTIPSGGSFTIEFANTVTGPIACPAGTMTSIYQVIPGWDTVTNASDGILGQNVETAQEFEIRRKNSVAANAVNTLDSIRGAVLSVSGVTDAYITDNSTASPVTVGGVTLAAYNLYVAAVGGTDADVAAAIWGKKPPGVPYYAGNTTVTVTDSAGYSIPYPTYSVVFERPPFLNVIMGVSISNGPGVPANAAALVQQAVTNAFVGGDGGLRATIGQSIYASRFYASIAALGPWASEIISVTLGSANAAAASVTASVSTTTMTVTAVGSGTLAVGQALFGANIAPNTYITALGTGTGGTGTYTVNISQTAASATVKAVTAALTILTPNINQMPVLNAGNVVLTLA